MTSSDHHHRPTLKQANKKFAPKHASKGSAKAAAKGKLSSAAPSASHRAIISKQARLNTNAQKRELHKKCSAEDARFFSFSSSGGHVPRIVSIVPLLPSVSPISFLHKLFKSFDLSLSDLDRISAILSERGSCLVPVPRFKTSLQINLLAPLTLFPTLDAALVSDYIVLLLSSADEVQDEGENILRCLQGQVGNTEVIACVQAPETCPISPHSRSLIHKSLLSFTRYFFPSVSKIHSSDTPSESLLLVRALCESIPRRSASSDGHAYLVSDSLDAVQWAEYDDKSGNGQLVVTGTVRGGGTFSADRLVHIPGRGDYQLAAILSAPPILFDNKILPATEEILSSPSSEMTDDLTATNPLDSLVDEQLLSSNEETFSVAQELEGTVAKKLRVPRGTSAYQASWMFDEDMDLETDAAIAEEANDTEQYEDLEVNAFKDHSYQDLDSKQEEEQYNEYIRNRAKADEVNAVFPDEIDTPRNVPARTRFQRYRGLKSFRSSPWDPYDDLPSDYSRIFQLDNYSATKKEVEAEGVSEGVKSGTRIRLVISNVPHAASRGGAMYGPTIVHSLLRHEHKQSVSHFVVQRNTEYSHPVKAKDTMILCVGPRRFTINPLYSQHSAGGGKGLNNVHKSEKFLRAGSASVLTTFGPIFFGKSACLLLKSDGSNPLLVATGNFLSADPTRIIAKRITLSGHPVKIHKKTATIRYMFFNREDIEYFKSVELYTKYGRTGHIQEPLGTHGYFKAHFDGPIQQMDTICMNLYKRQYPKWASPLTFDGENGHCGDIRMISDA